MLKRIEIGIEGVSPLLMHNSRLADPLNDYAIRLKEQTSKRNKTASDYEKVARIEWEGGAYFSDDLGLYLPGENTEAGICNAAKKNRLGMQAKTGVTVEDAAIKHVGGKTLEALWKDKRFVDRRGVVVQRNRVIRTRLKIPTPWSARLVISFNDSVIEEKQVRQAVEVMGTLGHLDGRPKFGRFNVV